MTFDELVAYITPRVQFIGDELTVESMQAARVDALALYNRYKPRIEPVFFTPGYYVHTFVGSVPDVILRVYPAYDGTTWNPVEPVTDWNYIKPVLRNIESSATLVAIAGFNLTLDDIEEANPDHINFLKLTVAKTKQFVSNPRRSATMNELPFELSGQQFFDEAVEEETRLLEEIQNEAPVWW